MNNSTQRFNAQSISTKVEYEDGRYYLDANVYIVDEKNNKELLVIDANGKKMTLTEEAMLNALSELSGVQYAAGSLNVEEFVSCCKEATAHNDANWMDEYYE